MQPRAFLCFYVRRRIRMLQHTVQREDILMLYCGLEFKMFKMVDKIGILGRKSPIFQSRIILFDSLKHCAVSECV